MTEPDEETPQPIIITHEQPIAPTILFDWATGTWIEIDLYELEDTE